MVAEGRDISGVALVTGGARGIGFEVARKLAQRGMTVVVGARDPAKAEAAAQELAGENLDGRAGTIDVTDSGSVKRLAAVVDEEFGKLDVLVNNAAVFAELDGTGVLVNSVDPGLTATAPGMEEMGARPVHEGAASVVWAATLPDDGPTGGFFRDGEPLPW